MAFWDNRFEAAIPIPVDPRLHESSTASQGPCDGGSIVTFQGQENSSIAIPLFGIALLTTLLTQLCQVLRVVKFDVHPTGPPVFLRVCQISNAGATPILTGAQKLFLIRIIHIGEAFQVESR